MLDPRLESVITAQRQYETKTRDAYLACDARAYVSSWPGTQNLFEAAVKLSMHRLRSLEKYVEDETGEPCEIQGNPENSSVGPLPIDGLLDYFLQREKATRDKYQSLASVADQVADSQAEHYLMRRLDRQRELLRVLTKLCAWAKAAGTEADAVMTVDRRAGKFAKKVWDR